MFTSKRNVLQSKHNFDSLTKLSVYSNYIEKEQALNTTVKLKFGFISTVVQFAIIFKFSTLNPVSTVVQFAIIFKFFLFMKRWEKNFNGWNMLRQVLQCAR